MSAPPVPTLRCIGDRPCPEDVAVHAQSASKLTPRAVEHLAEVLVPCVTEPMSQPLANALTQFSLRHEVAEADLGRTLRACRFVVREATATDLDRAAFAEDCALLFPASGALCAVLASAYEGLKKTLRTSLYAAALGEHGSVLTDVSWRVDLVATTSEAARLMMPVAMLTLRYREHGADRRVTLQVPGDVLVRLRDAAESMLKR